MIYKINKKYCKRSKIKLILKNNEKNIIVSNNEVIFSNNNIKINEKNNNNYTNILFDLEKQYIRFNTNYENLKISELLFDKKNKDTLMYEISPNKMFEKNIEYSFEELNKTILKLRHNADEYNNSILLKFDSNNIETLYLFNYINNFVDNIDIDYIHNNSTNFINQIVNNSLFYIIDDDNNLCFYEIKITKKNDKYNISYSYYPLHTKNDLKRDYFDKYVDKDIIDLPNPIIKYV